MRTGNLAMTKHARERSKQRLGLSGKVVKKNLDKIYTFGVRREDTNGRLKRYLDRLHEYNKRSDNVIYGYYVYVFAHGDLVTIFPLPKEYWKTVNKIKRRRNGVLFDDS